MYYEEIRRRIFDRLIKKNPKKSDLYNTVSSRIALALEELNKRELHDVHMAIGSIKGNMR